MPARSTARGSWVLKRVPGPALQPYVETLWAIDGTNQVSLASSVREHVLPTGQMHLAFRLSGEPLRLFGDSNDVTGLVVGDAVVGGARASHYIRDISRPSISVGAQLRPGAAEALFGVHADELAGCHTSLDDLWGRDVSWMREQLMETTMPHQRIDRLESILAARLSVRGPLNPVVPHALRQLRASSTIRQIVRSSGYSHRMLLTIFRRAVGLTPKQYARVLRFARVLDAVSGANGQSLADVAVAAGYSDQSHFNREFVTFAGVTPTQYRNASPELPHHLGVHNKSR